MNNSAYLKSVECGYMSVEESRKAMAVEQSLHNVREFLSQSGSSYPDTSWEAMSRHTYSHEFLGISDFVTAGYKQKITCDYCGRKNDSEKETCASCGAIL